MLGARRHTVISSNSNSTTFPTQGCIDSWRKQNRVDTSTGATYWQRPQQLLLISRPLNIFRATAGLYRWKRRQTVAACSDRFHEVVSFGGNLASYKQGIFVLGNFLEWEARVNGKCSSTDLKCRSGRYINDFFVNGTDKKYWTVHTIASGAQSSRWVQRLCLRIAIYRTWIMRLHFLQ